MTLRELAPELWLHESAGTPSDITRAIVRLSTGGLWIHSPPALTDELASAVTALGKVEALVAPNNAHHEFIEDWAAAFPDAGVCVSRGVPLKRPGLSRFRMIEAAAPDWAADLDVVALRGVPMFDEYVFLHRSSRTLIVCDLVQHYPPADSLPARLFLAPMGWRGICPPPPLRFDFVVQDRNALDASIETVRQWDFERIVVTHGRTIEAHARDVFETIAERIKTERGGVVDGWLMRFLLQRFMDGGPAGPT